MPSSKNPASLQVGPGRLPPSQQPEGAGGGASGGDPTYYLERPIFSSNPNTYPTRVGTGPATLVLNNGPVWLGDNAQESISEIFKIVDTYGEPLLIAGNAVTVFNISGATFGSGWVDATTTPITLSLSVGISAGVSFRVLYGVPATLANTADLQAANLVKVAGGLGSKGREDVYAALSGGLNERYNRSDASGNRSNTRAAGSGSVITRTGKAVTVQTTAGNWDTTTPPDPQLACFKTIPPSFDQTAFAVGNGGDIGFLHVTSDRATASTSEYTASGRTKAAVATYLARDVRTNSVDGTTLTQISAGQSAMLNPTGSAPDGVFISGQTLWHSTNGTAIHYGADLLEVTFSNGVVRSFVIYGPGSNNSYLILRTLTGETPSFPAAEPVNVRWLSAYMTLGGSQEGPFTWYQPRPVGTGFTTSGYRSRGPATLVGFRPSGTSSHNPLLRVQASNQLDSRIDTFELSAHGDLGTPPSLAQSMSGTMTASGAVFSTFVQRYILDNTAVTQTYYIDPRNTSTTRRGAGAGLLHIAMSQAAGVSIPLIFTTGFATPVPGLTCEILLENVNGGLATLSWGADFKFSHPNDSILGSATAAGSLVKFKLTQVQLSIGTRWLVERQDFLP